MAGNVCAVTHLTAAAPQTLPEEAVRRKWVKIKVARVSNRNGDQRDEGRTGRETVSLYISADTSCPDNLNVAREPVSGPASLARVAALT